MSAQSRYQSAVQWDDELHEPYLPLMTDCRITPIRPADVSGWRDLFNDPDVAAINIRAPVPYPIEAAQKQVDDFIAQDKPALDMLRAHDEFVSGFPFKIIRHYPSGEVMGEIHMYVTDKTVEMDPPATPSPHPHVNQTWDVGYCLAAKWRRRGIMAAALRVAVDGFIAPVMGLRNVCAAAQVSNEISHDLLRKSGFSEVYRYTRRWDDMPGKSFEIVKFNRVLMST